MNLVCVTKFTHSRVKWISPLLTCNLSFKFRFTVVMVTCCFRSIVKQCGRCLCHNLCASLLYFVVRVGCRRKTVHVRYLISWWASCLMWWTKLSWFQLHVKSWHFTVQLHGMQRPVLRRPFCLSFCLSVCLSVKRVLCDSLFATAKFLVLFFLSVSKFLYVWVVVAMRTCLTGTSTGRMPGFR